MKKRGWLRALTAALCLVGTTLTMAGCGSGSNAATTQGASASGVSSAASAGTAGKAPLKIGIIDNVGTALMDDPGAPAVLRAAARAVNTTGGADGRKVQVVFCNEQANAQQALVCAHQMVQDKVVAMIGGQTFFGPSVFPILQAAGIPYIAVNPVAASDFNSPDVYLPQLPNLYSYELGLAYAAHHGATTISAGLSDTPAGRGFEQLLNAVLKQSGDTKGFAAVAPIETTTADFAPVAAAAVAPHPKAIVSVVDTAQSVGLFRAATQAGYTGQYISDLGDITQNFLQTLGPGITNDIMYANGYPPFSDPRMKAFVAAMQAEQAAGDSAAAVTRLAPLDIASWVGMQAFVALAKGLPSITPQTITTALKTAKSIDLGGIVPAWTPTNPGPKGFARVSNDSGFFTGFKNGQPYLLISQPVSLEDAIKGDF